MIDLNDVCLLSSRLLYTDFGLFNYKFLLWRICTYDVGICYLVLSSKLLNGVFMVSYVGRDGLTHNMLNDIHNHWKHEEAVRIKCLGVPTIDMKNVCTQLEVPILLLR